ncbi:hypothetical protein TCAP_03419, partial [Tolypocladium capitatum]
GLGPPARRVGRFGESLLPPARRICHSASRAAERPTIKPHLPTRLRRLQPVREDVRPLQLPVPPPRPPAPHLHERIRAQLHAGHHGQEQERRHGNFLEMREDRRTAEPVHQLMLRRHGRLDSRELDDSIREKGRGASADTSRMLGVWRRRDILHGPATEAARRTVRRLHQGSCLDRLIMASSPEPSRALRAQGMSRQTSPAAHLGREAPWAYRPTRPQFETKLSVQLAVSSAQAMDGATVCEGTRRGSEEGRNTVNGWMNKLNL